MIWGGIGGVVGFLTALIGGALAGVLISGFIGLSCGRRAAAAEAGKKSGALSGLIGGSLATPIFVLGASAGSVISARSVSTTEMADMISEMAGMQVSPEGAWQLFLLSLVLAAFVQALLLILASTATGAWAMRKK
jgi:ABC-type dipeptide/oligopeptide/nickel transport system permease component